LKFPDAVKYNSITYAQVLSERLKIMDSTAIALCQNNSLPIFVFKMQRLLDQPDLGVHLFDETIGSFVKN
jgi:uridylate kinase